MAEIQTRADASGEVNDVRTVAHTWIPMVDGTRLSAKLWLPDPGKDYYQGLRFDWSDSVWSLEAGGHSYFGQWFPRYDPKAHGSITGPVEDYAPLHYDEAKPVETFVKIGGHAKEDGRPAVSLRQPRSFSSTGGGRVFRRMG